MKSLYPQQIKPSAVKFSDLPRPAQKAYIWFMGIECCNAIFDQISDIIHSDFEQPSDLDEKTWELLIDRVSVYLGERKSYVYFHIDTVELQKLIFENDEDLAAYGSWENYAQSYKKAGVPDHSSENRFPCISIMPDLIYDGWHRLHSYMNNGHSTIPILEIVGNSED